MHRQIVKKLLYILIILVIADCTLKIDNCACQWLSQPLPMAIDVYDIKFFDANTGVIATNDQVNSIPYLFRTTNGGNNWTYLRNTRIYQFHKINDSIIYAFGRIVLGPDMILRSFNKGATWDSLPVQNVTYRGLFFINKDTGWVSGFDGSTSRIWKTTNGGLNFNAIPLPGSIGWGKIFFLKYKINGEYYGWCSESGNMWRTTNSGSNWFQCGGAGTLQQLEFINENTGWASNTSVNILKTTDGGMNWINIHMPQGNGIVLSLINNFKIIDSNIIYGDYGSRQFPSSKICGVIWKTTNGGNNWGFQQPDTSLAWGRYMGIDFIDANTGWSSNIHTTNGGGPVIYTEILSNTGSLPKTFLLKQNYPNPFNPNTVIEFSIFKNSFVTLKVYDITGREMFHIISNMYLSAGEYKTSLDFSKIQLSSGVYFYRLETKDAKSNSVFSDIKRIMYIK